MPKISVTTLSWSRIAQGGGNVAQAHVLHLLLFASLIIFCVQTS